MQRFTDLPSFAFGDFRVEIFGDDGSGMDNYYVRYDSASSNDSGGVWTETLASGIKYRFNATTMPHQLVRETSGDFTFKQATWGEREVGDLDSAPSPSFIGKPIQDVFFFRNRR